jgi:hypothetical protein
MTRDIEDARRDLLEEAKRCLKAYMYELSDGYYYVTASPPGTISSRFVASAELNPVTGEARIREKSR